MYGLLRYFWQALKLAPKLNLFILFYYAAPVFYLYFLTLWLLIVLFPRGRRVQAKFFSTAAPVLYLRFSILSVVSRKSLTRKARPNVKPCALVMSEKLRPKQKLLLAERLFSVEASGSEKLSTSMVYMVSLPLDVIDCFWLHRDVISHTEKTYYVLRSLPLLIPVLGSSLF
jgi:hypothetical protein